MAKSPFSERLAFAVWLSAVHRGGRAPGNSEIGRAVGRSGPAVGAWFKQDYAPPEYDSKDPRRERPSLHNALADYLNVPKDWLIDGVGDPPEPELWKQWVMRQRFRRAGSSGSSSSVASGHQRKRGT